MRHWTWGGTLLRSDCTVSSRTLPALGHCRESVSKASVLAALLNRRRLGLDNVIAFGHDENGFELSYTTRSVVVMANARPTVVVLANRTTMSADEDDVAVVLEEYATA